MKKLRAEQDAAEKSLAALAQARARYSEFGHADNNGDAIAKPLRVIKTKEGRDIDGLTAYLKDNGCAVPKVDMNRHGATGCFRMVAGLMLRAAARKRPIKIGGQTLGADKTVAKRVKAKRGRKAKSAEGAS